MAKDTIMVDKSTIHKLYSSKGGQQFWTPLKVRRRRHWQAVQRRRFHLGEASHEECRKGDVGRVAATGFGTSKGLPG